MNYVPFLKYKVNEISALKALKADEITTITPFFDLPRRDELNEEALITIIDKAHRKYEINLRKLPYFYFDNYDIDDRIRIHKKDNYEYLLYKFSDAAIVPVVGVDREVSRNKAVIKAKQSGLIVSDTVALRLVSDDFSSYALIKEDITDLMSGLDGLYDNFHLIMDNRVCLTVDYEIRSKKIINFINAISNDFNFERIIITGSSIPASIRDILEPNSTATITRTEAKIFSQVALNVPDVVKGDYTTVSPLYSDVKIIGELMRRITAPKLIYSYGDSMYFMRGGALQGHPRGNKQYNDLSAALVKEAFFRKAIYSFGDLYLTEKALNIGGDATPSTIPKCLINAHMTYMLNDFM